MSSVQVQFYLFEHLRLIGARGTVGAPLRPRAERLLVYLLLNRELALSREQISFTLFPDVTEPDALAGLRRALSDVRVALNALAQDEWILADGGALRWNVDAPYSLDVQDFERLIQIASPGSLYDAVTLYRGDLVREMDDEWLLGERERLRQLQVGALEQLTAHHHALGEFSTALGLARRWLTYDPFSEAAHRRMITLHYEMGDRAAALAHYERLRAQLRNELGVEPMDETRAMIAAIIKGVPLEVPTSGVALKARAARAPRRALGRGAELDELLAQWKRAAAGKGSIVLLSGEAGIGKSFLAQALAGRVEEQGGLALEGYCYEFEQALPYQPVVEMMRAAAEPLRRSNLPSVYRAALARVAPDVLGALGNPGESNAPPAELRAQLFEALTQSFRGLAQRQPLLLVVEDAHWAAESTLDWLVYLAPYVHALPILVLITHRSGEDKMQDALANLEQRLRRASAVTTLALKPLSREANRTLVVELSHLSETRAQAIADRLYDLAAGNPFFVLELARGMIEAGQIQIQAGQWTGAVVQDPLATRSALPDSLRATIHARVGNLSERARAMLRVAAVAGRVFDHELVRRAGDWDDEWVLTGLEELLARNFIREGENQSQFYFAHHLVQDALYADMTASRRAYLHRRLAKALQELKPHDYEALAYHWLRAGDSVNAVRALRQQANRAVTVYAFGDALRALENASGAMERLRQTTPADSPLIEQEIQLLLDRVPLIDAVGRPIQEYERVVQSAGALLERYPNTHLQAQYLMRRAELLSQMAQYERAAESAIRAHTAFRELGDLQGAARGLYLAGINKSTISQNHRAQKLLEEALALYRQSGDASNKSTAAGEHGWLGLAAGESLCLSGLGMIGTNLGEIKYALGHLNRALELSEQHGDKPAMARACYILAICWVYYHHADKIEWFAGRAFDLYNEMGLVLSAFRPYLLLGLVHHYYLDIVKAKEIYRQCLTEAQNKNDTWLEGWAAQCLGRTALDQGELKEAERYLTLAFQRRHETGEVSNEISDLHWLGRLRLAQGQAKAALEFSQQAIDEIHALPTDFHVWEIEDVFFGHSRALEANGARDAAAEYLQRAYGELMLFAEQIDDPDARRCFFEYPVNAGIVRAWEARPT